jgi:hypothetical protein
MADGAPTNPSARTCVENNEIRQAICAWMFVFNFMAHVHEPIFFPLMTVAPFEQR